MIDAFLESTHSSNEIQVKILQILPLFFQNYSIFINGESLSKLLFVCSSLQSANKMISVINTAQATFFQLLDIAFEKVNEEDRKIDPFISLIKDLNSKYQKVNIDYFTNLSTNKKNFEDESKKYYDWLSKLLSSGKSKDEKLLMKMKNFEISKINYFNYLYDGVMGILNIFLKSNSDLLTSFTKYKMKRDRSFCLAWLL